MGKEQRQALEAVQAPWPRRKPVVALALAMLLSIAAAPAAMAGDPPDPPTADPDTSEAWLRADQIRERVRPPEFPDFDVVVTDLGADPTGEAKSTDAFRQAIDAVTAAGGGRVVVPEGEFLTGAIHLQSNVNLHLADDAIIKFSRDKSDYLPVVKTRYEGVELYNYSPFVYAYQVENVAVTGNGTLDGQADEDNWWDWKNPRPAREEPDRQALFQMGEEGVPVEERQFGDGHFIRPNFVQFYESKNILVQGVTLNNSPMWLLHPVLSENITIDGVHLESLGPNNDGTNPESSRDVVIKNTFFNTGDDNVAIKSGRNAEGRRIGVPAENILIEDNLMLRGHGAVVVGSEMSGGARNVFAQNNVMDSPNLDRVVRIKTNSVRGGVVENIYVRDNDVPEQGGQSVWVDFQYEEGDTGNFTPTVRNIYIENLHSHGGSHAVYLRGYARSPITNLNIINSSFTGVGSDVQQIQGLIRGLTGVSTPGSDPMLVQNVQGLRMTDVTINDYPADRVVCQNTVWLGIPEVLVDSGVADRDIGNRTCLSEQFAEDHAWSSPDEFRTHVASVADDLHQDGVITEDERDALTSAAGQTDIGVKKGDS